MPRAWACEHPQTPDNMRDRGPRGLECLACNRAKDRVRYRRKSIEDGRRKYDPESFPCGHLRAEHTGTRPSGGVYCKNCEKIRREAKAAAARAARGRLKMGLPGVYPCGHPRTDENARHMKGRATICRTCAIARGSRTQRNWRLANPEAARRQSAEQYRLRKLARRNPETFEWLKVLAGDPCSYCGGAADSVDHVLARKHGGGDHWTNYGSACRRCNSSKGDQSLLAFLLRHVRA